nr:Cro/CI family transcriptional regulator [Pseudomonas sp. BYT-1]
MLVKHFGTQARTAKAMGVSQATISYWLAGAVKISAEKALLAEIVTDGAVTAASLCPLVAQTEARRKVDKSSTETSPSAPGPVGSVCLSSNARSQT